MVMEINTSEMKRVQLFEIIGRVDSTNATELGNAMDRAVDSGRTNIVLDLSGVEYISSAGLREMVRVLELAGLDTIFEVYPTQVEAVGSF
jgi:anti-sigma B factor antagonist